MDDAETPWAAKGNVSCQSFLFLNHPHFMIEGENVCRPAIG